MIHDSSYYDIITLLEKKSVFSYSLFILLLYNLPFCIFNKYICTIDNTLCSVLTTGFYTLYATPTYYILYIYILNYKLNNEFLYMFDIDNTPSHPYSTLLCFLVYISCGIVTQLCYTTIPFLSIIPNTLSYSLHLSQIAYSCIDNKDYKYNSVVSFFNSNIVYFNTIAGIYSIFEYTILRYYYLELLGFFLLIIFSFPFLIRRDYSIKKTNLNVFYHFEMIVSEITKLRIFST